MLRNPRGIDCEKEKKMLLFEANWESKGINRREKLKKQQKEEEQKCKADEKVQKDKH